MVAVFDAAGVQLKYPENWRLEREETETGWTVSLQSPDTAFLTLTLRGDMPSTDALAEAALAALREEYPDLEAEEAVELIAGQPAVGHDVWFFSLDLTNTCWTRSFYTSHGTMLLLCQLNDLEAAKNEPVLKAICRSLRIDADD